MPASVWYDYYSSIASVNRVLKSIAAFEQQAGGVQLSSLRAARAEALLQRAYLHFVLVNLFAQSYQSAEANAANTGVPYLKEPIDRVDKDVQAGSVAEVYASIQNDLEEALGYADDLQRVTSKYRFNLQAAHAFAARFYLYTRQWQKVVDHANAVLGATEEQLRPFMVNYVLFDNARYVASPLTFIGGLVTPGNHGAYAPGKISETFEYTDSVAGIGYAHIVGRRFTAQELLLARAEAYIMGGHYEAASQDLMHYWNYQIDTFSEDQRDRFNNGNTYFTEDMIGSYYGSSSNADKKVNILSDWNFTQNISPDYVVPAEAVPLMNCLNDLRRFETSMDGLRFFDLKRWGMEYSHVAGSDATELRLTSTDPRRAIAVPWEAIYDITTFRLGTDNTTLEPGSKDIIDILGGSGDIDCTCSDTTVVKLEWKSNSLRLTGMQPGQATITVTDVETGQVQTLQVNVACRNLQIEQTAVTMAQRRYIAITSGSYDYEVESSDTSVVTAEISTQTGEPQDEYKPAGYWNTYSVCLTAANDGEATVTVRDKLTGQTAQISVTVEREKVFTAAGVQFTMIRVDGGTHRDIFTVDDFLIGQTEVTQALWTAVMGSKPSSFIGEQLPVNQVSYDDCLEFIAQLNALTGLQFRLPWSNEWEFAARGGNLSQNYYFAGISTLDEVAWHKSNSNGTTHEVGTKLPNEIGTYDMNGNVMEWCADVSSSDESRNIIRGGAYNLTQTSRLPYFSLNYITSLQRDNANVSVGLRLAY